jgi:hypothetical protein
MPSPRHPFRDACIPCIPSGMPSHPTSLPGCLYPLHPIWGDAITPDIPSGMPSHLTSHPGCPHTRHHIRGPRPTSGNAPPGDRPRANWLRSVFPSPDQFYPGASSVGVVLSFHYIRPDLVPLNPTCVPLTAVPVRVPARPFRPSSRCRPAASFRRPPSFPNSPREPVSSLPPSVSCPGASPPAGDLQLRRMPPLETGYGIPKATPIPSPSRGHATVFLRTPH